MNHILATTYAVNPSKGSEDGMGWNFIIQIARFNKVTAVTRKNNRPSIEKGLAGLNPIIAGNIRFEYIDLPDSLLFWKKGPMLSMIYYYIWQIMIAIRYYGRKNEFDIVHNLNFHNDWTPSFLWTLGKPFVWGPIGHHPTIPTEFISQFSFKERLKEKSLTLIKKMFWKFDPLLSITRKKADKILIMNSKVAYSQNLDMSKISIVPSVATNSFYDQNIQKLKSFQVLTIGRLVPLKGMEISIRAFASFIEQLNDQDKSNCKLKIIGEGPKREYLAELSESLKISEYIEFMEWTDRERLIKEYNESSVFLFPSHEGAGMVVAEALSAGLPVISFDNEGPGEFINEKCGVKVPYSSKEKVYTQMSEALLKFYNNPELLTEYSYEAKTHFKNNFDWNVRGQQVATVYSKLNYKQLFQTQIITGKL